MAKMKTEIVTRISCEDVKNGEIIEMNDGQQFLKIKNAFYKIQLDCLEPYVMMDEDNIEFVFNVKNGGLRLRKTRGEEDHV